MVSGLPISRICLKRAELRKRLILPRCQFLVTLTAYQTVARVIAVVSRVGGDQTQFAVTCQIGQLIHNAPVFSLTINNVCYCIKLVKFD